MGHGVTDTDRVAVIEGKKTWHGVNTVNVPHSATLSDWAAAAGLDSWTIELRPVYRIHPAARRYSSASGVPDYWLKTADVHEIPNAKEITRVGPGLREEPFALCSADYVPVQPLQQVEFIKRFADEGDIQIETMGSLLGGRKVWALLSLGESWEVNGGKVEGYLFVANSNDKTGAFTVRLTMIWVQCNNTFTAAVQGKASGVDIRVNHRTKWTKGLIDKIKKDTGLARQQFTNFKQTAELLANTWLPKREVYEYVAKLSGSADAFITQEGMADGASILAAALDTHEMAADVVEKRIEVDPAKLNRVGARILEHMLEGTPGAKPLNGGLTALDAFHHTTYYGTNDSRIARTAGAAINSAMAGRAADLKQKGLELLVQVAKAQPSQARV